MPKDKCCGDCIYYFEDEDTGFIKSYCMDKQCKCHSPKGELRIIPLCNVTGQSVSETQEGEVMGHVSSPSSFEKEVKKWFLETEDILESTDIDKIIELKEEYCLDKSIVERDYIEKQKVLDALEKAFIIFPEHRKLVNWLKEELL